MRLLLLLPLLLLGCTAPAAPLASPDADPYAGYVFGERHPQAPAALEAMGQLAGVWRVVQTPRNQDGSWSQTTTVSDWIFYYTFDGYGVQDDYITPPLDVPATQRFYGRNIRVYDPEANHWVMTWLDTVNRRIASFTATNEPDGSVLMEGTDASGRHARNLFSAMTDTSFSWTKQWTFDDGASWLAVARIEGTRVR